MNWSGRWRKAITLSASLLLGACGAATAGEFRLPPSAFLQTLAHPGDPRFDSARALIQRLVHQDGVPSITVAVAKDGAVVWAEGFGWANRESGVRATPLTPYSIASITKPITSTAVMKLNEATLIDLDAPIERYLGDIRLRGFAGLASEVTARRIMGHSAGLPTYYHVYFDGEAVPNPEQTISRYGFVAFMPGTRFEYSNIGFRLLDVAVSNASRRSYSEYLRDEIFAPLGMAHSSLGADARWASKAAVRYDSMKKPIPSYLTDHPGSGDVWSSAYDMLRFGVFHTGMLLPGQDQVITAQSVRAMQTDANPSEIQYGLGWGLRTDRGYRVVEHGGGQPGVSAQLTLYPDERLAIVVLSNLDRVPVQAVAERIAHALLPHPRAEPWESPQTSLSTPLPDLVGRWVGTVTSYEGEEPFALSVTPEGDIYASIGTRMINSLVREVGRADGAMTGTFHGLMSTGDVALRRYDLSYTLVPIGNALTGQVTARGIDIPFGHSSYARLNKVDSTFLNQYAGVYRHAQDDLRTITHEQGRLYSQRGAGRRLALEPIGGDLFLLVGTGGATLRFVREAGRVSEVEWSGGGRARRVD
jgi:CubicO group peptidase (beta-lactamase class C family)